MQSSRLEAFSDGVIAIIITIMVLETKVPDGADLGALRPPVPVLLSHVLSFVYVGIYWNNHHHLFQLTETVKGAILWANMHLLFWLSLLPFSTGWLGKNHFARWPTALYGINLLWCAVAFYLRQSSIVRLQGRQGVLAAAVPSDIKVKSSPLLYLADVASSSWLCNARAGLISP